MAVPKKRTSKMRKGLRHAGHTHKLTPSFTISCSNCGEPVLLHHVCPACGHYKKRQVFELKKSSDAGDTSSAEN